MARKVKASDLSLDILNRKDQLDSHQREALQKLIQERAAKKGIVLGSVESDRSTESFRDFVRRVNPSFRLYPHVEILIAQLQRVADGEVARLMIWMPPRLGKTELVSKLFSAYYLSRFPKRSVGVSCYDADNSMSFCRDSKRYFQESGGKLSPGAAANDWWRTGEGGECWGVSIGGGIMGRGYHLGIIDDANKPSEISSLRVQENIKQFWNQVWMTRFNSITGDPVSQVVVQQRLASTDLSGFLMSLPDAGSWTVLALDAIKSDEPFDIHPDCEIITDERKVGELLCEAQWNENALKVQREMNLFDFGCLFQQRPSLASGTLCCREDFEARVTDRRNFPTFDTTYRAWDVAFTKGGDWSCGIHFGIDANGDIYILDVIRERIEGPDVHNLILQTAMLDPDNTITAVERATASLSLVQALEREKIFHARPLVGINVHSRSGNLLARSSAVFSKIKNRKFVLPADAEWRETLIDEFLRFTGDKGDVDDQVSAMSIGLQAFLDFGGGVAAAEEELLNPYTVGFYIKSAERDRKAREVAKMASGPVFQNPF